MPGERAGHPATLHVAARRPSITSERTVPCRIPKNEGRTGDGLIGHAMEGARGGVESGSTFVQLVPLNVQVSFSVVPARHRRKSRPPGGNPDSAAPPRRR